MGMESFVFILGEVLGNFSRVRNRKIESSLKYLTIK